MVDESLDCQKNIELHFYSTQNVFVDNSVAHSKNRCGNCGATPDLRDLDFLFDDAESQMTPVQVGAKARADVRYAYAAPQCDGCLGLGIERVHGDKRNVENADAFAKKDQLRQHKFQKAVTNARKRAAAVVPPDAETAGTVVARTVAEAGLAGDELLQDGPVDDEGTMNAASYAEEDFEYPEVGEEQYANIGTGTSIGADHVEARRCTRESDSVDALELCDHSPKRARLVRSDDEDHGRDHSDQEPAADNDCGLIVERARDDREDPTTASVHQRASGARRVHPPRRFVAEDS